MRIELDTSQFSSEALAGLSDFSNAEILFYMDKVDPSKVEKTARHLEITPTGLKLEFLLKELKIVLIKLEQPSVEFLK